MKYPKCHVILLCVPILFALTAFAQRKITPITLTGIHKIKTSELVTTTKSQPIPFKNITVWDFRFDTSKIGYCMYGADYNKIIFENNNGASIEAYLNKQNIVGQNNFNQSLLIVLRSFWIQSIKAGEATNNSEEKDRDNVGKLSAKMDVYSFTGQRYKALIRIDTVINTKNVTRLNAASAVTTLLDAVMSKIGLIEIDDVLAKKREIEFSEIEAAYKNQFEKPRLKNNFTIKGVYLSFNDFINGKVLKDSFSLEQEGNSKYLYLEKKSGRMLLTDFWGFCDGKNHYIHSGHDFFELEREGNSFYFWGSLKRLHNSKSRSEGRVGRYLLFGNLGELHSNRLVNFYRPIQIDMETGKAL